MLTVVPLVSEAIPRVSGGGLTHNYIFSEAQFHWGDLTAGGPLPLRSKYLPSYNKFSFTGSEHTRSKVSFAMEIQFVHYKESLGSLSKAMLSDDWDSLAIISVFCYVIRISLLICTNLPWSYSATEQDPGSGSLHGCDIQCPGEHQPARPGDRDPLLSLGQPPTREPREILSLQRKSDQSALHWECGGETGLASGSAILSILII